MDLKSIYIRKFMMNNKYIIDKFTNSDIDYLNKCIKIGTVAYNNYDCFYVFNYNKSDYINHYSRIKLRVIFDLYYGFKLLKRNQYEL